MTTPKTERFDSAQLDDSLAMAGAMSGLVQAIALLHLTRQRLSGSKRDEASRLAMELVEQRITRCDALLSSIEGRIMKTSPRCHRDVRQMATRNATTVAKLANALTRMLSK